MSACKITCAHRSYERLSRAHFQSSVDQSLISLWNINPIHTGFVIFSFLKTRPKAKLIKLTYIFTDEFMSPVWLYMLTLILLQPVNFNRSMPSASSARILHGTRSDDSSPPPASAAVVVGSNGKPLRRRVVTALPELINSDTTAQLVTMIIIVLADLAADQRKKKKSGSMAPLLIVLLLIAVAAATGCAAADARGPRCSNDPNLPRRIRACGPPSIKPHN